MGAAMSVNDSVYLSLSPYRGSRGRLDNPGVFRSDEPETVQSRQETVDLFLETDQSPDLATQTHPKLKHYCPRWTDRDKDTEKFTLKYCSDLRKISHSLLRPLSVSIWRKDVSQCVL